MIRAVLVCLDELRKSFKISFKADLHTRNSMFTILLTAEDDLLPGAHRVKEKGHEI
jgi:hypothetical protein